MSSEKKKKWLKMVPDEPKINSYAKSLATDKSSSKQTVCVVSTAWLNHFIDKEIVTIIKEVFSYSVLDFFSPHLSVMPFGCSFPPHFEKLV